MRVLKNCGSGETGQFFSSAAVLVRAQQAIQTVLFHKLPGISLFLLFCYLLQTLSSISDSHRWFQTVLFITN